MNGLPVFRQVLVVSCVWGEDGRRDELARRVRKWSPVWSSACDVIFRFMWDSLPQLVGGLEHFLWLSIQLGMSSSQLTLSPSFFRGVVLPPTREIWGEFSQAFMVQHFGGMIYWHHIGNQWMGTCMTGWTNMSEPWVDQSRNKSR